MTADPITIRPLTAADVAAYRALRIAALQQAPDAFTASVEEEQRMSDAEMLARAVPDWPSLSLGAFAESDMVGMAGYVANSRPKTRHKGVMVAVYVAPAWRAAKVGHRIVRAIIDHAAAQRAILTCAVRYDNAPARNLYHRLGFVPYGIEKNAICIDGRYFDDELLALDLRDGSVAAA